MLIRKSADEVATAVINHLPCSIVQGIVGFVRPQRIPFLMPLVVIDASYDIQQPSLERRTDHQEQAKVSSSKMAERTRINLSINSQ